MLAGDKWLVCVECGREFLWDAGEQAWYQSKGLVNPPRRCKACREKRREAQLKQPRQYWTVSCVQCGAPAYVPFVPRGIKPIYCRSCYSNHR
jgi:CxxC-x17-CxxC domain-containing protein